jgi:hypothetical protein
VQISFGSLVFCSRDIFVANRNKKKEKKKKKRKKNRRYRKKKRAYCTYIQYREKKVAEYYIDLSSIRSIVCIAAVALSSFEQSCAL